MISKVGVITGSRYNEEISQCHWMPVLNPSPLDFQLKWADRNVGKITLVST